MKAYGKKKRDSAGRKIRGTSRECPCCIPIRGWCATADMKKAARREGKKAAQSQVE